MCHAQARCAVVPGIRARQGARPRGSPQGAEDPDLLLAAHGCVPRRACLPCTARQHPTEPVRGAQRAARLILPDGETIVAWSKACVVQHARRCSAVLPFQRDVTVNTKVFVAPAIATDRVVPPGAAVRPGACRRKEPEAACGGRGLRRKARLGAGARWAGAAG